MEYDLRVASNGVLVVDDDSVLRRWHKVVVSTADGAVVRVTPDAASDHIEPNKVFLSKGATYAGKFREHWFFIGVPGGENDAQKTQEIEKILEGLSRE